MKEEIHAAAIAFCQRTGARPVAVIEEAMKEGACIAIERSKQLVHEACNDLMTKRETGNRDNRDNPIIIK